MPKTIPEIFEVNLGFDEIARSNDQTVLSHFRFTMMHSKRRLFPKRIQWNAARIRRSPKAIMIDLLVDRQDGSELTTVARFGFIPPPDFSRMTGY